jgi:hypothetical protein
MGDLTLGFLGFVTLGFVTLGFDPVSPDPVSPFYLFSGYFFPVKQRSISLIFKERTPTHAFIEAGRFEMGKMRPNP